jgi:hypothetical protein
VGAGKRLGVHGCVLAPSPHFPGESCLSCPKCGGTDITLTGAHGPGGRLGDPGGHSWAQCGSCGWRSALEPVKW